MDEAVIAVDVGGTLIKAALVGSALAAPRAEPLVSLRVPTDRELGVGAVVDRIADTVLRLRAEASARGLTVAGAGVVVPGIVDSDAGIAVFAANLGWRDLPLRDQLAERTELPIAFDHDVRAGGLAEARLGAGRGVDDFLFLPIGTGIAGAIVLGGKPWGGRGYAGEIGHVVVDPAGEPCGCGARGCLETIASAAAIQRRYAARTGVTRAAEDITNSPEWDAAIDALAFALAGYVSLLAPELIVVGGGLATAGDLLLGPLRDRLAARLPFQRMPRLVTAELGSDAGRVGAALLALEAKPAGVRR